MQRSVGTGGVRIRLWWGIFSGLYGFQKLGHTPTILAVLPHSLTSVVPILKQAKAEYALLQ
ncbi:MAG TPA: hypothetical protein VFI95_25690 [Terriglobales bacterium]|nr:hypothetical protein [Terriglobales bacterium]